MKISPSKISASEQLQAILAPIAEDMKALDAVVVRSLSSDVALINQIANHLIQAGGKRIRPALLFLISKALSGGRDVKFTHQLAAVVEFIHSATLLHDDVVDDSKLRRGRKTANAIWGNAASVLVGDFLYSRAFQMMILPGEIRVMEVLSNATNLIAEGEVLQLLNLHDADVDEQRYRQVILYKTAKLFEASAELGAFISNGTPEQIQSAADFGTQIGVAFQLVDDWLDYTAKAEDMGKNAGDDLREGKPTLPLIYMLQNGSPSQQQLAREAIEHSEEFSEEFFNRVFQEIQSCGALQYTLDQAQLASNQARECLKTFPNCAATDALHIVCDYSLARSF